MMSGTLMCEWLFEDSGMTPHRQWQGDQLLGSRFRRSSQYSWRWALVLYARYLVVLDRTGRRPTKPRHGDTDSTVTKQQEHRYVHPVTTFTTDTTRGLGVISIKMIDSIDCFARFCRSVLLRDQYKPLLHHRRQASDQIITNKRHGGINDIRLLSLFHQQRATSMFVRSKFSC